MRYRAAASSLVSHRIIPRRDAGAHQLVVQILELAVLSGTRIYPPRLDYRPVKSLGIQRSKCGVKGKFLMRS
jgi:hypothetical protein